LPKKKGKTGMPQVKSSINSDDGLLSAENSDHQQCLFAVKRRLIFKSIPVKVTNTKKN